MTTMCLIGTTCAVTLEVAPRAVARVAGQAQAQVRGQELALLLETASQVSCAREIQFCFNHDETTTQAALH